MELNSNFDLFLLQFLRRPATSLLSVYLSGPPPDDSSDRNRPSENEAVARAYFAAGFPLLPLRTSREPVELCGVEQGRQSIL